jgi:hypothetical protein
MPPSGATARRMDGFRPCRRFPTRRREAVLPSQEFHHVNAVAALKPPRLRKDFKIGTGALRGIQGKALGTDHHGLVQNTVVILVLGPFVPAHVRAHF